MTQLQLRRRPIMCSELQQHHPHHHLQRQCGSSRNSNRWCNNEPIDGILAVVAFRNSGIQEDQLGFIGTTLHTNGSNNNSSHSRSSATNGSKSTC